MGDVAFSRMKDHELEHDGWVLRLKENLKDVHDFAHDVYAAFVYECSQAYKALTGFEWKDNRYL